MSRRTIDRWEWACYVAAGRLTTAQRAVLVIVARHARDDGSGSRVSQTTISEAADLVDRSVRRALTRLERMGLVAGEVRPGKTTIWSLNFAWTPDTSVQSEPPEPRTPASRDAATDPGRTPDAPRTPVSYEGEGEATSTSTPSLTPNVAAPRREGEVVEFDPNNLPGPRRLAAA